HDQFSRAIRGSDELREDSSRSRRRATHEGLRMATEVLQGTLDLMVLRTLDAMGPQHGFGLAKRILQVSEGQLDLNQGTLYPALLRLEHRRWIKSRWGVSENNRKAKFYELTARGRRQIHEETKSWETTVAVMARFLAQKVGAP